MSTEEQLGQLRRQIRRLNQALALVAVLAVSAVLLGAAMQTKEGIMGKYFAVKDENGKVRMMLGKDSLFFLSPDGKPRVALRAETEKDLLGLSLNDPTSGNTITLAVGPDFTALWFTGKDQARRIVLSLKEKIPSLSLYDTTGKKRLGMSVIPEKGPIIGVSDAFGSLKWVVSDRDSLRLP